MFTYTAIVRSVYDGDTFRADMDLGFGITNRGNKGKGAIFRLAGLNTPEIKGSEREKGLRARDFVLAKMPVGTRVVIESIKDRTGKYGRYLAKVHLDPKDLTKPTLNEQLITSGHAEVWK